LNGKKILLDKKYSKWARTIAPWYCGEWFSENEFKFNVCGHQNQRIYIHLNEILIRLS